MAEITRQQLVGGIEEIEKQKQAAVAQLNMLEGARQILAGQLEQLDKEATPAKKKK